LYLYHVDDEEYLLIVNASRMESDWDWLQAQYDRAPVEGAIDLKNASAELAAVAIQGPRVAEFVNKVVDGGAIRGTLVGQLTDLTKNQAGNFVFNGISVLVARTGYTGEDGFEIVAPADAIESIFHRALDLGRPCGLVPAGLGARDTLRTEMGYPLYGHELNDHTTPIEAGLAFFVALDKCSFCGREVLAKQKAAGVARKCVAFKMTDKSAPPRPHYPIWAPGPEGARLGEVGSGTQSPSLGVGIGLGYVPFAHSKPGTPIEIEVRGRRAPAVVVAKPIYRKA
jgi:aminomethyltransferase